MMTKARRIVFLIGMLIVGQMCWAQVPSDTLSDEEKKQLEIKVKQKIDDFLSYLSQIGSKHVSDDRKNKVVKGALDLFIGKGYKYYYEDEWGNKKEHAPVTMQTTNKYGRVYPPKPMTLYLDNMRKLRYTEVRIERAAAVRVDDITPTGVDNQYKAVAYYYQKFIGVMGDGRPYIDYTQKRVSIYIEKVQIPTPDGTMTSWRVQLGDIAAVETH